MFNFFNLFEKKSKGKHDTEKQEFSKFFFIQQSFLIWIYSLAMLVLAYICVFRGYFAVIPWFTAISSLSWSAYAVSQHAYYKKAQAENTKDGIKYEAVMADYQSFDDEAVG